MAIQRTHSLRHHWCFQPRWVWKESKSRVCRRLMRDLQVELGPLGVDCVSFGWTDWTGVWVWSIHVSNSTKVFEASMSSFFAGYIPRSLWPGIVLTEEAQLQKMTHNIWHSTSQECFHSDDFIGKWIFSWRLVKWQLSVKTLLRSVRSYHILVIQFSGWWQTTLAHACVLRAWCERNPS